MRRLFFLFIFSLSSCFSKVFVTYEFTGGRFGDDLISYLHAKWFEFKFGYKLLYKPFPFSEKLELHVLEEKYSNKLHAGLQLINYEGPSQIEEINYEGSKKDVLLMIPFYPESNLAKRNWNFPVSINVDWSNEEFRRFILSSLKPRKQLSQINIPEGYKSIAIHVRTGIGFDNLEVLKKNWPSHCLPLDFFIIQLKEIMKNYSEETKFYCHIFTDHPSPPDLKDELEKRLLEYKNLVFACTEPQKKRTDFWNNNLLEDFFSLFRFDCLIRPDSHFSILPSLLKNYELLIYPKDEIFKKQTDYYYQVVIEKGNNHENT